MISIITRREGGKQKRGRDGGGTGKGVREVGRRGGEK